MSKGRRRYFRVPVRSTTTSPASARTSTWYVSVWGVIPTTSAISEKGMFERAARRMAVRVGLLKAAPTSSRVMTGKK